MKECKYLVHLIKPLRSGPYADHEVIDVCKFYNAHYDTTLVNVLTTLEDELYIPITNISGIEKVKK